MRFRLPSWAHPTPTEYRPHVLTVMMTFVVVFGVIFMVWKTSLILAQPYYRRRLKVARDLPSMIWFAILISSASLCLIALVRE